MAVLATSIAVALSTSAASGLAPTVALRHAVPEVEREPPRHVRVLGQGVGTSTSLDGSTRQTPTPTPAPKQDR